MHARAVLREGVLDGFAKQGFKRPFLFQKPDVGSAAR
jgi:hypothetical protein